MLIKSLVVLQVCLLLCQAEQLTHYESQTVADIVLKPVDAFKLCQCEGDKCVMDEKAADGACKVLMQHFESNVYPSGFMAICEFLPKSCEKPAANETKAYYLRAVYDSYYLRVSPFIIDKNSAAESLTQLFKRIDSSQNPAFDNPPESYTVKAGTTGMPVEFDGILNLENTEISDFEACHGAECRKAVNQLCSNFTDAMKAGVPDFMKHFIGCHVRDIYQRDGQIKASWSVMLHYYRARQSGAIKKLEDLNVWMKKIQESVKPAGIVKEFTVTGMVPLDACEIEASALTNMKYHRFMNDPTSSLYHVNSGPLYTSLRQQLHSTSCVRQVLQMNLDKADGFVKATSQLWVSLACFQELGLKSCEEVTQKIEEVWKEGSKEAYNYWTPEYKFKLLYSGTPFEV